MICYIQTLGEILAYGSLDDLTLITDNSIIVISNTVAEEFQDTSLDAV